VQGETKIRWQALCEQAAVEQDPARLLELVREINDLLSKKQERLEGRTSLASVSASRKCVATRILIADDSQIVRTTLKNLLVEQNPAWDISEAENGHDALEKAAAILPHIVLLDLNLPDMPGHEAVKQIRRVSAETKIIVCSFSDSAFLAATARYFGADGYFAKGSSPADLHKAITSVLTAQREKKSESAARSMEA
jgi:CheY-like chemotaxis protein